MFGAPLVCQAADSCSAATKMLFDHLLSELLEMDRPMSARALEPWPMPLRTLDALHLATVEFLRAQGEPVLLASYDARILTAARALGVELVQL